MNPETYLRPGLALAIGLLIGLQRERDKNGPAGIRTFALIALASAPLHAQDLSRMIADRVPLASNNTLISTNISDALPVAAGLERVDELTPLPLPEDFRQRRARRRNREGSRR